MRQISTSLSRPFTTAVLAAALLAQPAAPLTPAFHPAPIGGMMRSRLTRLMTLIAISAAAALAAPALASADVYCVGSPGGTCDVEKPDTAAGLQGALTEADQSGDADLVRIGPGTYAGNFVYQSASEVDIEGSAEATVIQGTGNGVALWVGASGSGSVVSDLEVRMASVPDPQVAIGLLIGDAMAAHVRVVNPGDSLGDAVVLSPGGDLVGSRIFAGAATGISEFGGTSHHEVRDTFITAAAGVETLNGLWSLERLEISAKESGVTSNTTTNLRNSLVRVSGVEGKVTVGIQQFGPGVLTAEHVTVRGGSHLTYGARSLINSGGAAAVNMKNSIVAGSHTSSFARGAFGGGTANISVGHSNFAPPDQSWVDASKGPGVFQQTPNGTNTNLDPKFVDPMVTLESPTVDFRLRHDSPLIDKGQPGGSPELDLGLEPRVIGDGTGDPVADMGAYEYQRRAPTAVIASPGGGVFPAGAPVGFSAAGSHDPDAGDTLAYTWSFGDGASGTGASAAHTYGAGGQRTATLTVTDPAGLTSTATTALLIEAPATPSGPDPGQGPGPGGNPEDRLAPGLSAASLSAPVFRVDRRAVAARRAPRGTSIRFTLSEGASVRYAIARRSPGRRVGDACRTADRRNRARPSCVRWVAAGAFARPASAGANAVRFAGRVRVRGRTRSLAPGRYRLTLVATDAFGNSSAGKRLPFRVAR